VAGNLSLHGVTREIVLDATFVGAGINPVKQVYTIGFDIRGTLRRSDFGVLAALPQIGEEVGLIVSAAFELQSS
jgi:polyisoprenoid-binding protein YceI